MLRHCCCLDYKYYHLPTDFGSRADFVFVTGKQKQNSSQIFVLRPCPLSSKGIDFDVLFFQPGFKFRSIILLCSCSKTGKKCHGICALVHMLIFIYICKHPFVFASR